MISGTDWRPFACELRHYLRALGRRVLPSARRRPINRGSAALPARETPPRMAACPEPIEGWSHDPVAAAARLHGDVGQSLGRRGSSGGDGLLLPRRAPDVILTAVLFNHGWLERELRQLGIETAVVDERQHNPMQMVACLTRFLRAHAVDIVHTRRVPDSVLGSIAATLARVPLSFGRCMD